MSPALNDGDYVVTMKPRSFRPGNIFVINHIDLGRIIKRLDRVEDNKFYFMGDNPNSTPSSIIAPVPKDRITGMVKWAIGPGGLKRLPA